MERVFCEDKILPFFVLKTTIQIYFLSFFMLFFRKKLKTLNRIEIIKENILHNYDFFQKKVDRKYIIPVLKSNAYGHGIEQAASIFEETDCMLIAVDSYYEAIKVLKHSSKRVLLIGYTAIENLPYINFKRVSLTVYDTFTLDALARLKKKVSIHLKIHTGMSRQGLPMENLSTYLAYFKKYPFLTLEGVFSHFADSDNSDQTFTRAQTNIFNQALDKIYKEGFHPGYIHLGATNGALFPMGERVNSVRIGIGLFGYHTLEEGHPEKSTYDTGLRPALRCISTIINVVDIKKGDKVSYNCTFEATKSTRIAVIPFGYYEGLTRKLSNKGVLLLSPVKSQKTKAPTLLPIAGRVCMNLTCLDAGEQSIHMGDEVIVMSANKKDPNCIDEIARISETITYEILVKLSQTIRRVIV